MYDRDWNYSERVGVIVALVAGGMAHLDKIPVGPWWGWGMIGCGALLAVLLLIIAVVRNA